MTQPATSSWSCRYCGYDEDEARAAIAAAEARGRELGRREQINWLREQAGAFAVASEHAADYWFRHAADFLESTHAAGQVLGWPPEWWYHAGHGLHDEAHHQAHRPLDMCVPLNGAGPPAVTPRS